MLVEILSLRTVTATVALIAIQRIRKFSHTATIDSPVIHTFMMTM